MDKAVDDNFYEIIILDKHGRMISSHLATGLT